MVGSFTALVAREKQERRRYARRREGYKLWCALGTKWVSAFGVDISASGLGLVLPVEIHKGEVEFRASLDDKQVILRAKTIWDRPGTFRGQIVHRYGLKITGISAGDWDALIAYCSDKGADERNRALDELNLVRMQPDEVARLIPHTLQRRMLLMLVGRKRLAPLDTRTPLVQYAYGGRIESEDASAHRFLIHSRVIDKEMQTHTFDTRFIVSEDYSIVTIDE